MGYMIIVNIDISEDTNIEEVFKSACAELSNLDLENEEVSYGSIDGKLVITVSGEPNVSLSEAELLPSLEDRLLSIPFKWFVEIPEWIFENIKDRFKETCTINVLTMSRYMRILIGKCIYKYILQQYIIMEQRALQRGGLFYYESIS